MGGRPNRQEIFFYESAVPPRDSLGVQRRPPGIFRRRTNVAVLHDGALLPTGLLEEILGIQLFFRIIGGGTVDHLESELRFQRGASAELELSA